LYNLPRCDLPKPRPAIRWCKLCLTQLCAEAPPGDKLCKLCLTQLWERLRLRGVAAAMFLHVAASGRETRGFHPGFVKGRIK
jgi:hypothetical protein